MLPKDGPNLEVAGVDVGYTDDGYYDHDETEAEERSYTNPLAEADFDLR